MLEILVEYFFTSKNPKNIKRELLALFHSRYELLTATKCEKPISVTCRSGVLGHGPALAEQSRRVARRLISSDPPCAVDDLKALRETLGEAGFQAPGQGKWLFRWVVCIPRCAQCYHGRYCFQLISVEKALDRALLAAAAPLLCISCTSPMELQQSSDRFQPLMDETRPVMGFFGRVSGASITNLILNGKCRCIYQIAYVPWDVGGLIWLFDAI